MPYMMIDGWIWISTNQIMTDNDNTHHNVITPRPLRLKALVLLAVHCVDAPGRGRDSNDGGKGHTHHCHYCDEAIIANSAWLCAVLLQ